MEKESRISLFKLCLEVENKEYNGTLSPSSCIQKIYISVIDYIESFLCLNISTFLCCRWFFMGLFSCKNCTSVLYSVGAYLCFLCVSDLRQFLFINDLLLKGWLIYKTAFCSLNSTNYCCWEKGAYFRSAVEKKES